MASFPGSAAAGSSTGEGVAVIGDLLYVMATGSDEIVVFDITPAESSTSYIFGDSFGSGTTDAWDSTTP
jgi:hypothetical protein